MKNKLVKKLFVLGASLFTLMALSVASSACIWDVYQPEEPKSLREE